MSAEAIDVLFTQTRNVWDIVIDDDGDLKTVSGFQTSLLFSLFTDGRATESEAYDPLNRRGALADQLFFDFTHGSKLWLLDQARNNFDTLNKSIDLTKNALQWLIDDSFLKKIEVEGQQTINNISLQIEGTFNDSTKESWSFNLWQNTLEF